MLKKAIKILTRGEALDDELMKLAMLEIMEGKATPAQIACFLTALKIKSETPEEISSASKVIREKAISIRPNVEKLIDTCGTGGDGLHTFNISTLVAFGISAFGIPVAKHGNRSISSSCGSADLIEALGIPLNLDKSITCKAIEEIQFGYLFAPLYHPAMKYATPVRQEIGIRTIFNILGPLANPANPDYQIIGVYENKLLDSVANALKNLKLKSALVVHARDGMDEISIFSPTDARLLKNDSIRKLIIQPQEFGINKLKLEVLRAKDLKEAKIKALKVIQGIDSPELDIVALNTAWALFILDEVKTPQEGFLKAKEIFLKGEVLKKLKQIQEYFKDVSSN